MPWSGGTYTKGNAGTGGWTGDAGLGIGIEAGRHDTQDNDFANGINNALAKDGQNTPTANLSMGGYKHTGVGNASAADQYMALGQLLDASKAVQTSGTAPNYTVTLSPAPTTYFDGMIVAVKCHSTFTGGSQATINVNGLGAKNIRIRINDGSGSRNVYPYEMLANVGYLLQYDGAQFYLLNPQGGFALDTANKAWVTGGTQPNYTVDIYPAPASYTEGLTFTIKPNSDFSVGGTPTINVNGLGAKELRTIRYSTTSRLLEPFEINNRGYYTISYNSAGDYFEVHNPTFGGALTFFSTTVGSSGGTLTKLSENNRYAFLNGRTVFVQYRVVLDLSVTTSTSLTLSLPFNASGSSANRIFGSGYVSSATGVPDWLIFPFLTSGGNIVQLYLQDNSTPWPVDNNFLVSCWGIYELA